MTSSLSPFSSISSSSSLSPSSAPTPQCLCSYFRLKHLFCDSLFQSITHSLPHAGVTRWNSIMNIKNVYGYDYCQLIQHVEYDYYGYPINYNQDFPPIEDLRANPPSPPPSSLSLDSPLPPPSSSSSPSPLLRLRNLWDTESKSTCLPVSHYTFAMNLMGECCEMVKINGDKLISEKCLRGDFIMKMEYAKNSLKGLSYKSSPSMSTTRGASGGRASMGMSMASPRKNLDNQFEENQ